MHKSIFGKVVRTLRLQHGWTQERLASLSNLERTFISMLERGVKQPSLATISHLSHAFSLKNHELLHLVEQAIHARERAGENDRDHADEAQHPEAIEAEAEMEKSRMREIANCIPVVFFARTPMPEYAATFVSSNIQSLLGFDRQHFMGASGFWLEHIHPEDQGKVRRHLQHIPAQGLLNHEYRFLAADGQWVRVREELRSAVDESGLPREVLGAMTMAGLDEN